jgi:hypothetical protein
MERKTGVPTANDPRRRQLQELLDRLPAGKAEQLRDALRAQAGMDPVSPRLAEIIDRLSLRAGDAGEDQPDALMRRICMLFEPFLVSLPEDGQDWVILRSSLGPWWTAAMVESAGLRRCEENFIQAVRARNEAEIKSAVLEAYDFLAETTRGLVTGEAAVTLGRDLHKIASLLTGHGRFTAALAALGISGPISPGREIEFNYPLISGFNQQFRALTDAPELDAAWLGHAIMNRLARPWTGVRLVRAVREGGNVTALAEGKLAPLVTRAFWHLSELGRAAGMKLRRAARIRRGPAITEAATVAHCYFAALDEVMIEANLGGLARAMEAHLAECAGVMAGVANMLGLFEGVIASFLHHWQPRAEEGDAPEFSAALEAAALLGAVKAAGPAAYSLAGPVAEAGARLIKALGQPPGQAMATGAAIEQWSEQHGRLLRNLRLKLR